MSPRTWRAARTAALWATLVVPMLVAGEFLARAPIAAGAVAVLVATGIVARRRPVIALAAASAAMLIATPTGQGGWSALAVIVVSFVAGRTGSAGRWVWAVVGGAVVAALAIWLVQATVADAFLTLLAIVGTVLVPWWVGSDARVRDELVRAGWDRASRLEREQRLVVSAARHEERNLVAADMHDALGYELSVLALTAGAAEVDAANTPEQRAQFTRVREAAVRAVDSLHEVLRLLRSDESPDEAESGALEELVARSRASGATVDAHLDADPSGWPPIVRRAAYRIVQELLANAGKHAPGLPLELDVSASDRTATIHARNPRPARRGAVAGSGSGLLGVGERARALGGRSTVTVDAQWFDVCVTLPLTPLGSFSTTDHAEVADVVATAAPAERVGPSPAARRWRIAVVPLAGLVLVAGTLFAFNAITAERLGLSSEAYDAIRVGMTTAELEPLLPPSHLDELPPVFTESVAPRGAECWFYRGSDSWISLADAYVRLCFAEGELVSKDRIE